MNALPQSIIIREVGLRDGLQSIRPVLPTHLKREWVAAAYRAGLREIEIGSFVPATLLPQLADSAEVLEFANTLPDLAASVLIPNLKGAERALGGRASSILVPLSASRAHSIANLRRTPREVVAELHRIRLARDSAGASTAIEVGISTAFGCTLQGAVRPEDVLDLIRAALDAGAERVSLADTVGYADPSAVSRLFEAAMRIAGDRLWGAHFHDTRGLALANVHAALQLGIRRFDASLGGLGGCPHAPGASGNAATEDLAFMLASMELRTGIELQQLLELRRRLAEWLPGTPLFGALWRAGLPKTYARESLAHVDQSTPVAQSTPAASSGDGLSGADALASPLKGLRVVEFSHMVMGPACGMILADLGAEVIKVEPPGGDKTRNLPGLGCGFFRSFNRNKKSVIIDLQSEVGRATAKELIATCDVLIENFRPGHMRSLGLDYASLQRELPRLIYVSHKGFLPGPYEHRTALDEVVQMMGGLAYMTGPEGRPLRAGSSVNDIMGGMFGVIGALAALRERERTGRGQEIQSALFENCAFLCAQHVQQYLMSGEPPRPMPARTSAWSVYDVFDLAGGEQLFLAATSDRQFITLCGILHREDLAQDPALASNAQRVAARPRLLAELARTLAQCRREKLETELESAGLPYAPILRPDQLLQDPHLRSSGALAPLATEDGGITEVLLLPFTMNGRRLGVRMALPRPGDQTHEVLEQLRPRVESPSNE